MHLKNYKLHFVGIGGVGMCGLAELLFNFGARVTGSDLGKNANTERLSSLGIICNLGHKEEYLEEDVDVLVYSSAVNRLNPELLKARKLGIPVIPRAEILSEIMNFKRGIAIGGTHGKTTTTSIIGHMLYKVDLAPTILVGGRLDLNKSTAMRGEGDWLVAEADESDGSFLRLNPEVVVITNIDFDHMDFYHSEENLIKAFSDFALKAPFYGLVVACGDDDRVMTALSDHPKKVITYGFKETNDYWLLKTNTCYEIHSQEGKIAEFTPPLPGRHNALNSLAAFLVGRHVGSVDDKRLLQSIESFSGVGRRMELLSSASDSIIRYDDYAHHPTELRASLQAIREKFPNKKILGVFQPHRYSRTQLCWDDFLDCFKELDRLVVTDIYAASENEIPGITGERFLSEIHHPDKHFVSALPANPLSKKYLQAMDVLISLGAGNIYSLEFET